MSPTAATEVLLGLPPLQPQLEAEDKARVYRLSCNGQWKPKSVGFGNACMTRNMVKDPIIQMGTDDTEVCL
jgi:hypothetical protein